MQVDAHQNPSVDRQDYLLHQRNRPITRKSPAPFQRRQRNVGRSGAKKTTNSCDLHCRDGVWTVLKRSLSKGELWRLAGQVWIGLYGTLATFRPSLGNILPHYVHTRFREHQSKQALETTICVRCLRQRQHDASQFVSVSPALASGCMNTLNPGWVKQHLL